MRSITLQQAAWFAALAMVLLTGFSLVDNATLLGDAPALVLLGSTLPGMVWAGFFFALHRGASSARTVAWVTLAFAVVLEIVMAYLRFQQSVSYWTPFGNVVSVSGWLLRIGWIVFLISFALAPEHVPDSRTRQIALVVAIIAAPSALSAAFDVFNNGIGFLFDDMPRQALWRALITPAIRTVYWLSQILFLWRTWGNPQGAKTNKVSPVHFTP